MYTKQPAFHQKIFIKIIPMEIFAKYCIQVLEVTRHRGLNYKIRFISL